MRSLSSDSGSLVAKALVKAELSDKNRRRVVSHLLFYVDNPLHFLRLCFPGEEVVIRDITGDSDAWRVAEGELAKLTTRESLSSLVRGLGNTKSAGMSFMSRGGWKFVVLSRNGKKIDMAIF